MNNCNFIGRLTKDPEAKNTENGKVYCNFSIAVDKGYKDSQGNRQADFIPCVAWENTAKLITQYFKKGNLIGISGRLESRSYEDNGSKRTAYSILVNNIDFIQSKTEAQETKAEETTPTPPPEQISLNDNIEEEGLPFDI